MSYALRNDIDLAMLVHIKQQIAAAQQGDLSALKTAQAIVDGWIAEISPFFAPSSNDVEPEGEPTMPIYDDAYLNYYCDRYVSLSLKCHGVRLVDYLAKPAVHEERALGPLPPLPQQLEVQRQIDAETRRHEASIEHLPRRAGVPTERLRHKRHPKRSWVSFFTRKVKV
tara:strand:+ start:556 stop:1062 length:507 start_codon:yes stop_codon:yes gene_type:complete